MTNLEQDLEVLKGLKKLKIIQIYKVGHFYESTFAIRCKDVKDIEEARKIILNLHSVWQDEYTDEEYIKKFGKPKTLILGEEICHLRYTGEWITTGYEYRETDWIMTWKKTNKTGRGSMECYVFYLEDHFNEYQTYVRESELKEYE